MDICLEVLFICVGGMVLWELIDAIDEKIHKYDDDEEL